MGQAYCRTCGKPIQFVRTVRGKMMPCEPGAAYACLTGRKNDRLLLTEDGESVHGYLTERDSPVAQRVFLPHFVFCEAPAEDKEELAARRAKAEDTKRRLIEMLMKERGYT